jgi:uncharacterized membrane protein (UPF0127 family)
MEVRIATGFRQRLFGLAMRRAPAHALLIPRCRSVHTFGMRVPLDLHWLGPDGQVLRTDRAVGPGRVRSCRGASAVLELAADTHKYQSQSPVARGCLGEMILRILRLRRRRASRRQVEERLSRYRETFVAPAASKQAGLERLRAEFERGRGPEA